MKVAESWKAITGTALDLILPPLCLSCNRRTAQARSLCGSCWSSLLFIEEPRCPVWGEPFAFDAGSGLLSARALATPAEWKSLTAAVVFNDMAARLVHALKYHDRLEGAELMARLMHRTAQATLAKGEVIIPIPLHRFRLWRRRYNQAALLAKALAKVTGKQYAPRALVRHRRTSSQVGLDIKARESNLRGAFSVPEGLQGAINGKRVVLVDDVLTTGATANAAAQGLLKAGAREIDVVVFALVLMPGRSHMSGS